MEKLMQDNSTTIGTYNLKTHLAAIINAVKQGREYIITQRGEEVARLIPAGKSERDKRLDALIEESRKLRDRTTLGGISWKELRDAGRRYLD
jgi:prevent-host-death family protein